MKCIGNVGTFPKNVTISNLQRIWNGFLRLLSYVSSDVPGYRIEVVYRGDAAFVLPVDTRNENVYLVRQPRYTIAFAHPHGRTALERALGTTERIPPAPFAVPFDHLLTFDVPAGTVESGEDPAVTAVRELKEETGITCQPSDLTFVGSPYASIGGSTERLHLFIAEVGDYEAAQPKGDGNEKLEVWKMTFGEAFALVDKNQIVNSGGRLLLEIFRRRLLEETLAVVTEYHDNQH